MAARYDIPKHRAYVLHELTLSLNVIKDAQDALACGRRHHLLPLSGQLRALLTERSKNALLLISLARDIGLMLDVYVMPEIRNTDGLVRDGLIYQYMPFMLSHRPTHQGQIKTNIAVALDYKIIEIDGRRFSTREIIMRFAQQAGGVQFDRNIDRHVFQIMTTCQQWLDVIGNVLCKMGRFSLDIGNSILSKTTSQCVFLLVSLPEQKLTEACPILDAVYPRSAMRITLLLSAERHIVLRIVDYMGSQHIASSGSAIELGDTMVLILSVEPRQDLTTEVRVILNDQDLFVYSPKGPLGIYQTLFGYTANFNRTFESPSGVALWKSDSDIF